MKPRLFHSQGFGVVGVDDQERWAVLVTEGVMDKVGSVDGGASEVPKLSGIDFIASKTAWKKLSSSNSAVQNFNTSTWTAR